MLLPKLSTKILILYLFNITQHLLSLYAFIHQHLYIMLHHKPYRSLDVLQAAFLPMITVWWILVSDIVRRKLILDKELSLCLNTFMLSNTKTKEVQSTIQNGCWIISKYVYGCLGFNCHWFNDTPKLIRGSPYFWSWELTSNRGFVGHLLFYYR